MSAKTLMIQGTGSDVGKSIITAGLCRYFFNKGWNVAPFKAQNMSLNSFVTQDGGEMGRAQVYQAEACGLKPHVAMNPVLLKPSGDNLSQVILMGKPVATRNAKDYYAGRGAYKQEVREAFQYLKSHHELIILEGAGSPAEINLREVDFVNMAMAEMADAPVLLVGDIDRGGVFAWLKGTYDLLTQEERNRVQGFIINKFRGDLELLKPGLKQLEQMTQKPVLGVIPFDRNLFVDEEDNLPYSTNISTAIPPSKDTLDVAVVRLPRISNFTDFSSLVYDPSIHLRYVWTPHQMGSPDIIILPGTKNTVDDLDFLYQQNLHSIIRECHENGAIILGICGGFQMMGKWISDPDHLESRQNRIEGLGWFDFSTEMKLPKTTRQVEITTRDCPIFDPGLSCNGYEIHVGVTKWESPYPALFTNGRDTDLNLGICNDSGTLIGTYLHGFIDDDTLRGEFLNHVRKKRGRPVSANPFNYLEFRQNQLNRLGNLIGQSLDMNRIEQIIFGEGIRGATKH